MLLASSMLNTSMVYSLILVSDDEKSDLLTWLLIDIESKPSKAFNGGFIPSFRSVSKFSQWEQSSPVRV